MHFVSDVSTANLIANLLMLAGVVLAIYILIQVRRLMRRVESVMAPKTGIESYLAMCAQVVESDPDGTCVAKDDGEIVLINRRMEDISGYHRSELVGQQVEVLVPEISRSGHRRDREGFTMNPASRPMRGLELRHKRGVNMPVQINLSRYLDTAGGFTIAKVRVPQV